MTSTLIALIVIIFMTVCFGFVFTFCLRIFLLTLLLPTTPINQLNFQEKLTKEIYKKLKKKSLKVK